MSKFDEAWEYIESSMFYPYPTKNKTVKACFPDDTLKAIHTALTQAAEIERGNNVDGDGWRPIETAPKDGMIKSLYGCYKNGKWYTQITTRGKGVGGLHVNVPTGFRSYTGATHWMPLPQPPKED